MGTPALSVRSDSDFDDMTDEELDQYFASCIPLSNLPTPPPAKDVPILIVSETPKSPETQYKAPELEVYATHLSKLVPTNVSPLRPCVAMIQGFLERANLPPEIVAFAACVLDALSQRFASSWRNALLPMPKDFGLTPRFNFQSEAIARPELIVLSALSLSHGFLSDRDRSTKHWAQVEGTFQFTVGELEASKWCIFQDIDYGLPRITEEMVQRMLRDMQRSLNISTSMAHSKETITNGEKPKLSLNLQGSAVWMHGVHTPEPSP